MDYTWVGSSTFKQRITASIESRIWRMRFGRAQWLTSSREHLGRALTKESAFLWVAGRAVICPGLGPVNPGLAPGPLLWKWGLPCTLASSCLHLLRQMPESTLCPGQGLPRNLLCHDYRITLFLKHGWGDRTLEKSSDLTKATENPDWSPLPTQSTLKHTPGLQSMGTFPYTSTTKVLLILPQVMALLNNK